MYVYQNSGKPVHVLDDEGRTHIIPNAEPLEVMPIICMDVDSGGMPKESVISSEKLAAALCEKGRSYGLVLVPQVKKGLSITFDVEAAAENSTRVRMNTEDELVRTYVTRMKEEALQNRPIRPPSPSIQAILDARGQDLQRDYGITPVGYKVGEGIAARDAAFAELQGKYDDLSKKFDRLMDQLGENAGKKKAG